MTKKRVVIESPFAWANHQELIQHIFYAQEALKHSLELGEAPIVSHLLYPQVWNETAAHREKAFEAGDSWREKADLVAIYTDLGVSSGMFRAIGHAREAGIPYEHRYIAAQRPSIYHGAGIVQIFGGQR